MNRVLISVLAASLAATTVPAVAQTALSAHPAPANWKPLRQRQDDVAARISTSVDSGALTDAQAHALRDQFKGLLNLEDQYRKTGMTPDQQADLEARYDTLDARIQVDSHPASITVQRAPD